MKLMVLRGKKTITPVEFFTKILEIVDDGEKIFFRRTLGNNKEFRIFMKKEFFDTPEKKKQIMDLFQKGREDDVAKFLETLWLVKSKKSFVLLLVPKEKMVLKKEGWFFISLGDGICFPTNANYTLYFKESVVDNVFVFYLKEGSFVLNLFEDGVKLILNLGDELKITSYQKI